MADRAEPYIPPWLRAAWTLFVVGLIPVWWWAHGPENFLWFSDIALFGSAAAMWLRSRLIASMMALAVLIPELVWNVDFFGRLLTGRQLVGISEYMWASDSPRWVRAMSLFHLPLPAILVYLVHQFGYDPRALPAQTALAWVVLPLTWALTGPEENINWVYGLNDAPQWWMTPELYLAALMVAFPLLVYVPTHFVLKWWRGGRRA